MSSLAFTPVMNIMNQADLPLRDRSLAVALVVLAHALVLLSYTSLDSQSRPAHREMSISVALPNPPQTRVVKQEPVVKPVVKPAVKPEVQPIPVQPQPVTQAAAPDAPEVPVETPASSPPVESSPAQPVNAAPALPDREPDYRAAYLNNPLPAYPMVARRMGWQGRVVLNVEVLESGLPGQIKLHQSSGRDVLDNAAMQAVRGWKFVAARQNGQAAAKSFLVPIPFILKESE
ncbi:MAG: TonB family protein [Gallionella sp.]|nr:TonB family protein [Gallionella sp.]